METIFCPNCRSDKVSIARDMKATRNCQVCNYTWLPIPDRLKEAQAEIAELKEIIKREVVPDIKDAEIARLRSLHEIELNRAKKTETENAVLNIQLANTKSALDVAVEGLELVKADSSRPLGEIAGYFYSKETYDEVSSALDKIKQIRG